MHLFIPFPAGFRGTHVPAAQEPPASLSPGLNYGQTGCTLDFWPSGRQQPCKWGAFKL